MLTPKEIFELHGGKECKFTDTLASLEPLSGRIVAINNTGIVVQRNDNQGWNIGRQHGLTFADGVEPVFGVNCYWYVTPYEITEIKGSAAIIPAKKHDYNGKCNICGHDAMVLFNSVECSISPCKNFR